MVSFFMYVKRYMQHQQQKTKNFRTSFSFMLRIGIERGLNENQ